MCVNDESLNQHSNRSGEDGKQVELIYFGAEHKRQDPSPKYQASSISWSEGSPDWTSYFGVWCSPDNGRHHIGSNSVLSCSLLLAPHNVNIRAISAAFGRKVKSSG